MTDRLGIAVEVGGGHTTCALVDGSRVLDRTLVDGVSISLVRTLETVEVCVRTLLAAAGVEPEDCIGVSVAFCGIVDASSGRVVDLGAAGDLLRLARLRRELARAGEATRLPDALPPLRRR